MGLGAWLVVAARGAGLDGLCALRDIVAHCWTSEPGINEFLSYPYRAGGPLRHRVGHAR